MIQELDSLKMIERMDSVNCENIYVSCASNRYSNCMDTKNDWIIFGTANSVAIYDLNVRRVISVLSQHSDSINSVRWIHTFGNYFISSSVDKTSIIWEKIDDVFKAKYVLNGHSGSVMISDSQQVVDSDGQPEFYSVSSSNDKCLCLWRNDKLSIMEKTNHFNFDVRIYTEILIPGIIILTAGSDNLIRIDRFDPQTNKLIHLISLRGHGDWVRSIDMVQITDLNSEEKLMLASASQDFQIRVNEIRRVSKTETVNEYDEVFRVRSRHNEEEEQFSIRLETILSGHDNWVLNVKWINFGSKHHLLTCSMDKTIILWERESDDFQFWNEKIRLGEMGDNAIGFLSCSFISSSDLILGQSFNGSIHIWRKLSKQDVWGTHVPITGHFKEVTDLAWEPEGEYFLTCSADQTTRLHSQWKFNGISWHEIARPQIHGYDLKSIAMFGRLKFVSGADEKVIRIFNATKNFIDSLQALSSLNIGMDGDSVAQCAITPSLGLSNSAIYDTTEIDVQLKPKTIVAPPTEEVLKQNTLWWESQKLYGHGYEIFAVDVNHSSTLLASSCKATNVQHASIILWDLKTFKKITELQSHNLTVTQIRFSPDDAYLLSVSRDRTWSLFKTSDPTEFPRIAFSDKTSGMHSRIIWDCAWTPDSRYFLTGSRDKSIMVWSMRNYTEKLDKTISPEVISFDHPVTSVDVHPRYLDNHRYLVGIGLENGSLFLYSLILEQPSSTGGWTKIYDFSEFRHTSVVNRIRFSPKIQEDGSKRIVQIASCSQDRSVKLFEITIGMTSKNIN